MPSLRPLHPPYRLLCGPGPANLPPSVRAALAKPLVGHLDAAFWEICAELVDLLGRVYRRRRGASFPVSASGTSGLEAALAAVLEPGQTLVVAVAGFFGARLVELGRRAGARVVALEAPWGRVVPNERLLAEVARRPETAVVAVVHGETSTGALHPIPELGRELLARDGPLLLADCVTTLGGSPLEPEAWGVDLCVSCSQKCLGAPPGMSPISLSERAVERVRKRRTPVPFSLDLELLARYWLERPPLYHHTAPVLHVYALHEALRLILVEGLEARWQRHAAAGAHLQRELRERGFELLADPAAQLPQLTAVRIPDGVDGPAVQRRLLAGYGIEVGGGLGPDAPPMWRIGLMGENARPAVADRILFALDQVLGRIPPTRRH